MAGGRPTKYSSAFHPLLAEHMARLGMTDKQMAERLGIAESTFNAWKQKHAEFSESLKAGKEEPDNRVERALFERATGYSHPAVKIMSVGMVVKEIPYTEHYPPDATSMIFWLKNRRPEKWRDKHEVEHSGEIDIGDESHEKTVAEIKAMIASGILNELNEPKT